MPRVLDYKCLSVTLQKLILDSEKHPNSAVPWVATRRTGQKDTLKFPTLEQKSINPEPDMNKESSECRALLLDFTVWEGCCNNGQWVKTTGALSSSDTVYDKVICSLLCNMGVFSCFGWNKTKIFVFLNYFSCVIKSHQNQHLLVVVNHFKLLKHVLPICGVTYHGFYSVLTTSQGIFLGTFCTSIHSCSSIPEHSSLASLQIVYFGMTVHQQNNFFTKLCYLAGWNWESVGKVRILFHLWMQLYRRWPQGCKFGRFPHFRLSLSHMNCMCKYRVKYIYFVLTTSLTFTLILQLPLFNFFCISKHEVPKWARQSRMSHISSFCSVYPVNLTLQVKEQRSRHEHMCRKCSHTH